MIIVHVLLLGLVGLESYWCRLQLELKILLSVEKFLPIVCKRPPQCQLKPERQVRFE